MGWLISDTLLHTLLLLTTSAQWAEHEWLRNQQDGRRESHPMVRVRTGNATHRRQTVHPCHIKLQITSYVTSDVNHTAGHGENKRDLDKKKANFKKKLLRHLLTNIDQMPLTDMRSYAE